jgi:hypothetical protein
LESVLISGNWVMPALSVDSVLISGSWVMAALTAELVTMLGSAVIAAFTCGSAFSRMSFRPRPTEPPSVMASMLRSAPPPRVRFALMLLKLTSVPPMVAPPL